MDILLLSVAIPAIVMVVVIITSPQAEGTMIEHMVIQSGVVAMSKVYTIVGTTIRIIAYRYTEVEVIAITITRIDAHTPLTTNQVYGTEEIIAIDKLTILTAAQHIHQVLISHVEQIVIIVNGIVITIRYIIYHLIHLVEEVKIYLVYILILAVAKSQFVSHTVSKETSLATDIKQTHRCITLCTDSCQSYKHHG